MSRLHRIALVGCGDIAETGHLPALLTHPRFELVAACDIRPERAKLLAGRAGGIRVLTDYRALVGDRSIDAVVLALHPEHSVDAAIAFLSAGTAVLDEKPLACTLADGERVAAAVRSAKGVYQIGFVFRYSPFVRRLSDIAVQIGRPSLCEVSVFDEAWIEADTAHTARIQGILAASSAITHEGSHVLDYASNWMRSPLVRASAEAVRTDPRLRGPNLWDARLSTADGSLLGVRIGWMLPSMPPSSLRLSGPGGWLTCDLASGTATLCLGSGREEIDLGRPTQEWAAQLNVFASAIDRGRAEIATVDDGLRALAASEACEHSARTGAAVAIAQPALRAATA